jgi:hypothetical protein
VVLDVDMMMGVKEVSSLVTVLAPRVSEVEVVCRRVVLLAEEEAGDHKVSHHNCITPPTISRTMSREKVSVERLVQEVTTFSKVLTKVLNAIYRLNEKNR